MAAKVRQAEAGAVAAIIQQADNNRPIKPPASARNRIIMVTVFSLHADALTRQDAFKHSRWGWPSHPNGLRIT